MDTLALILWFEMRISYEAYYGKLRKLVAVSMKHLKDTAPRELKSWRKIFAILPPYDGDFVYPDLDSISKRMQKMFDVGEELCRGIKPYIRPMALQFYNETMIWKGLWKTITRGSLQKLLSKDNIFNSGK
ncbi:hypothetical protein ElyMa_002882700 [Elysia marginata]|uniref:Dynein heavy chain tail domain-containing protein n=1 Tax=Elysia marginata TaxID=1093978 RepID=A0AAV4HZL3_9GAST|nr:hypothetical protein ElyMa_002882700 [Elysia marginata]